ncbi:MAG: CoA-binding protein [Candidatus Thermoplasmatota archaeon]|nr:CoA-binding protein [Candidatus Thermoplasmatota archaeon]
MKSEYALGEGRATMHETEIDEILRRYRTVAVVGLSKDPFKDSHMVAKYLADRGFEIIPVNPTADSVLDRKAYPSLTSIPDELKSKIEIVDIFRPSDEVPAIVDEAIRMKRSAGRPFVIWLQLGIRNDGAAAKASLEGISAVQDRCIMIEAAGREEMSGFRV